MAAAHREASRVMEASVLTTPRRTLPMPKLVDVKALRAEAKDKRNQIAEIRKSRVAANADLRAAQKVVADIDKTLNKAVADLAKIKAKIDKATG